MAEEKKNIISIERVPGEGPVVVTVAISIDFDPGNVESVERFAQVIKALTPEGERAQFMADFERAGKAAGPGEDRGGDS